MLSEIPTLGQKEEILVGMRLEYRRIILRPYFKLIYTICNHEVVLVDIWDIRQSSDKLKDRISTVE